MINTNSVKRFIQETMQCQCQIYYNYPKPVKTAVCNFISFMYYFVIMVKYDRNIDIVSTVFPKIWTLNG